MGLVRLFSILEGVAVASDGNKTAGASVCSSDWALPLQIWLVSVYQVPRRGWSTGTWRLCRKIAVETKDDEGVDE
jgi:hypothetical protein